MKYTCLLVLGAAAHAIVLPDALMSNQVVIESKTPPKDEPWWGEAPSGGYVKSVERFVDDVVESAENTLDGAIHGLEKMGQAISRELGSLLDRLDENDRDRHRHDRERRPGSHKEEEKTMWEMIRESKYTTRFYKLVEDYPEVKERLKDKKNDYTLFVPTDRAFEDLGDHKKPSKEFLEDILQYHLVPGRYAAGRVMSSHTLPTCLSLRDLGNRHQRLRVSVGLLGIHINFYSKVVATNIEACNGYIHAVDRILVPPPRQGRLIDALPGKFSTFSLAMERTGLGEDLHDRPQRGGTVFVPTNYAWMKLGPRLNAFLFAHEGEKYLRALLRYHVVMNETLYSDAYYEYDSRKDGDRHGKDRDDRRDRDRDDRRDRDRDDRRDRDDHRDRDHHDRDHHDRHDRRDRDRDGGRDGRRDIWESLNFPGGNYYVDMRTCLGQKRVSVDVRRWMGLVSMTVNGWIRVSVQDGISQDGVVHVIESVLMPPRGNRHDDNNPDDNYENDNMSVDELKDRLRDYVDDDRSHHGGRSNYL